MKNGKEWSNGEPNFSFITFILLTKQSKRSEASFIIMGCIHRIIVHDLGWDSCFWNENGKKTSYWLSRIALDHDYHFHFDRVQELSFLSELILWKLLIWLLSFKSMKLDGHTCVLMYTSGFQMLMQLDLREFELTWTHSNSSIVDFQNTKFESLMHEICLSSLLWTYTSFCRAESNTHWSEYAFFFRANPNPNLSSVLMRFLSGSKIFKLH